MASAVGKKRADGTAGEGANLENEKFKIVAINVARVEANKHVAQAGVGDAKVAGND